ncbi:hypothetical protein PSPTOT1_2846 [Pseudomonas syringae pv. tomato T1]|nr:hypothetical protein PSPTOT1_2846 [Pseudomonas syringae pv. tomato T1]
MRTVVWVFHVRLTVYLSLSALSVIQVQSWRFLRVMTKTRWGANKVGRWRTFIGLSASLEVNASRNATALIGIKA